MWPSQLSISSYANITWSWLIEKYYQTFKSNLSEKWKLYQHVVIPNSFQKRVLLHKVAQIGRRQIQQKWRFCFLIFRFPIGTTSTTSFQNVQLLFKILIMSVAECLIITASTRGSIASTIDEVVESDRRFVPSFV